MSSKAQRRAAREVVAAYHEARLSELVHEVGDSVDLFRAGALDAFDVDQVLFQYSPGREGSLEVLQPLQRRAHRPPDN